MKVLVSLGVFLLFEFFHLSKSQKVGVQPNPCQTAIKVTEIPPTCVCPNSAETTISPKEEVIDEMLEIFQKNAFLRTLLDIPKFEEEEETCPRNPSKKSKIIDKIKKAFKKFLKQYDKVVDAILPPTYI